MSKSVSKMIVGGATFGNKYGATNQGMMTEADAVIILNGAFEAGFLGIDSAPAYGESERVMGLADIKGKEIYTKISGKSLTNGLDEAFSTVLKSLANLGVEQLTGLTFHSSSDYLMDIKLSQNLVKRLLRENLIQSWGVSLYSPEEIYPILNSDRPRYLQVPVNLADHRFLDPKVKNLLDSNEIHIHARSIFLQGILLQEPSSLDPYFQVWAEQLSSYRKLASEANITILELALGFVLSQSSIERYVIGLNSMEQLREISTCTRLCARDLPLNQVRPASDLSLIDPRTWG